MLFGTPGQVLGALGGTLGHPLAGGRGVVVGVDVDADLVTGCDEGGDSRADAIVAGAWSRLWGRYHCSS